MKIIGPENVSLEITRLGPELIVTFRRPGHIVTKLALDLKEAVTIRNTIAACLPGIKRAIASGETPGELNPDLKTHLPPPAPEVPGFTAEARPAAIGAPQASPEQLEAGILRKEDKSPV